MSISFFDYLIFPSCLVTVNAYGSDTQLYVTQNADTFANINHVDIQRTFDIREYRYDVVYFPIASLSDALVSNARRELKLNLSSRKNGNTLYFSIFKMHKLHLQY